MQSTHNEIHPIAKLSMTTLPAAADLTAELLQHHKGPDWRQLSWAKGVEGQRKADLGDGRYLNPVLAGDHADPSVLKDGDDYYMVHSSFDNTPGLLIWHSWDLVNWQPIGPAL